MVGTVSAVYYGLLEGTGDESVSGLCYQNFRRLSEFLFKYVVGLSCHLKDLRRIRKGIYVRHYVILMLEEPYSYITFREMLPLLVSLMYCSCYLAYGFFHVLAVGDADLALKRLTVAFGNFPYQFHMRRRILRITAYYRHSQHPGKLPDVQGVSCLPVFPIVPYRDDHLQIHIIELGNRIKGFFKP